MRCATKFENFLFHAGRGNFEILGELDCHISCRSAISSSVEHARRGKGEVWKMLLSEMESIEGWSDGLMEE